MSDDEAALLRAICAEPDEDTPRLVYADWLDEQGDALSAAHAAFIRLSVAEARTPTCTGRSKEHVRLLEMIGRSLVGNALARRMGLSRDGTGYSTVRVWERGFPAVVGFPSVAAWNRSRLFERVPILRCRVRGRCPHTMWSPSTPHIPLLVWRAQYKDRPRHRAELPWPVWNALTVRHYDCPNKAFDDAERAFVDAGRAACGLAPRFHRKEATES